ncbi:nuclear transport factor 2 family protein [Nocardia sp. NBC_00565]|uniref:nuclear transport factor 2 family protein n=1 Tax=Nocardia sp. NBC_00565 TaxID=2975993 RepID=UPI002E8247F9|nr:nuclear transport factor 2 family protein [Nocardia sp. NBC_00565]WUC05541.1 nuclear transport factor 2 family protein [Nocardia sp. NBC_00565]
MKPSPEGLLALLNDNKIRSCIAELARGEDRRDAELISASFWPDATTDFGIFAGSFGEYLAWVVPGSPAIPVTQHVLGQTVIELKGDVALAETHVTAYHRIDTGTEQRDAVIAGRYLDRLEKRNEEWRIAQRTMLYDWFRDYGASVDWSQGIMGTPLHGDHYTGRAVGDYSEIFFGKRIPSPNSN